MRHLALLISVPLIVLSAAPAAAQGEERETVQSDVSTREISIQSNFTGIEIVLFGSIDFTRAPSAAQSPYDVVMVVRGPAKSAVVWRKERVAGIWVNGKSETFPEVPTFYAVLASRSLRAVAPKETLKQLGIGFDNIDFNRPDDRRDRKTLYRAALIRLKKESHLFQESDNGVTFIGRSLFRGSVRLPVNVPMGRYTTQVFLFRDGKLLSESQNSLQVNKVGLERFAYALAFERPFLYGVMAALMAVMAGLLAWAFFRRA
jgi:uncharacterized protein (TIGR02186 family)